MKDFKDEFWVESTPKNASVLSRIKDRLLSVEKSSKEGPTVEDRYELESIRTLSYQMVSEWIIHNKKDEYDGALLVRIREKKESTYPITVGIMFLQGKEVCLGREHIKKIVHCSYIDQDLNDLFQGEESVIIK
jgi:hypothetical protein